MQIGLTHSGENDYAYNHYKLTYDLIYANLYPNEQDIIILLKKLHNIATSY